MELLERNTFLADLAGHFEEVESGAGHTVFLFGEAGIGKTSLLNAFAKLIEGRASMYLGACDLLFTPRPLGPLFDIAEQIGGDFKSLLHNEKDRVKIFGALVHTLSQSVKPVVIIFEDIHWADEASFDLIKFLSRRINRLPCLLILSYRDDEIHGKHPLATLFGELPSGNYTKLSLTRFSREIVGRLASEKGPLTGDQLFQLTSGNPFYVMEILSHGDRLEIPERVKDAILARFHSRSEQTKAFWEFLSILPSARIEPIIADFVEQDFGNCMDECIAAGIIISRPGYLSFNHELFRKTIEESLPASKRKSLHKRILEILRQGPEGAVSLSQLVHHARYADEHELVAVLAPRAAKEAAAVSAHREAAKLYSIAIDLTRGDSEALAELYEHHAYECYLTYQVSAAIASQQQALTIWRAQGNTIKEGDALRFLSRLWWFAGEHQQAVAFAKAAIDVLENKFREPTKERALAYSNYSQLGMLSEDESGALHWGNKAIELATLLDDQQTLSHALNNVGTTMLKRSSTEAAGEGYLNKSLAIGLEHGFHEHAARSYVNKCYTLMVIKKYARALEVVDVGIKYCEDNDLDFLKYYMLAGKASMLLETGAWDKASQMANELLPNTHHLLVKLVAQGILARLAMRYGEFERAASLIAEIKDPALATREIQRIVPVIAAELELSWLSGQAVDAKEIEDLENSLFATRNNSWFYSDLTYWKKKCGLPVSQEVQYPPPYAFEMNGDWKSSAELWGEKQAPYEQALALLEGDEDHQRQGFRILDELGATGTAGMFRAKLKLKGARNIPRGPRESTLNNPAQLTDRQIDIVKLLSAGLQNKEIADKLFISPKTVDHHISAILTKLDVSTRAKAVLQAKKLGILN